jgi:peptidoglycan hydrolase CwlO-like protein
MAEAIHTLVREGQSFAVSIELHWIKSPAQPVTKSDLEQMGDRIMSKIAEFAAVQKAFNERLSKAVDGLVEDVRALNDKIAELQSTPGEITAEDQALLDELTTMSAAAVEKLEALDALTPPPVPPTA